MTGDGWLGLVPPPGWTIIHEARRRWARRPGVALELEWHPLRLLPDSHKSWVDGVLLGDLPAGGRYDGLGFEQARTHDGWEVTFAAARLHPAAGPPLLRLGAFYVFMAHGAHALVTGSDAAAFEVHRPALREVLLGGRPDVSAAVATLADFWDGLEPSSPQAASQPTAPTAR